MIIRDDPSALITGSKALLINPPIRDTQYWPRWSQPHGLLKVATWLKEAHGYTHIRLLDCLATDRERHVKYFNSDVIERGDIRKKMYHFGWPLEKLERELERHASGDTFYPDEIWITSIMTYWWESTRDVVNLIERVFQRPGRRLPKIYVGGIYPTLFPEHADKNLSPDGNVVIVPGEISPDAANSWTDLTLYKDEVYEAQPKYAIVTGSRGCPFNCAYCAQLKLNAGSRKMRYRTAEDIADELEQKYKDHDIREIAFYEDNLLFDRGEFLNRLDAIQRRGLKFEIYAPEGIEPRLIEPELLKRMRAAGFKKLHLALETIDNRIAREWNRKQATIEKFDHAVEVARENGYPVGSQDLNAFVIFGIPDEDLQSVMDTALYASHRVGSVVPMLFTPVPGSIMYDQYSDYIAERKYDLQDLNGKLLPFLEYNQRRYPKLKASDYLQMENLMYHLNSSKVYSERFDFASNRRIPTVFRDHILKTTRSIHD